MADEALLTLDLPATDGAAAAARKALSSLNGSMHLISEARLRDAQLLVTELVSNAVRHGGSPDASLTVVVRTTRDRMRVEVADAGGGFDVSRLPGPSHAGGGWGLHIVARLAHRWGIERGDVTTVWYEIDRPQREAPVTAGKPAGPVGRRAGRVS